MHPIINALFLLLRTPLGTGTHRKALRRRHVERVLRTAGMSRKQAERVVHHIP